MQKKVPHTSNQFRSKIAELYQSESKPCKLIPWAQSSTISKGLFALMLCIVTAGVYAQGMLSTLAMSKMNTSQRVEQGLQTHADHIYRLKAAKTPRVLPPMPWSESLQSEAKTYARNTQATVVLEAGHLVYESYGSGVQPNSLLHGYSIAKSLTAFAVGEALCAGHIKSLDDLAQDYVPALKDTAYGQTSIRNLLGYTSGAEDPGGSGYEGIHSYSDFGSMMDQKLSLEDLLKNYGKYSRYKSGEKFIYNGLNSEALSLVIRVATGMSLPAWFEATVWQEAGAEYPAAWFLDREGNGVAEVLTFMSARDHARIGLYVLERLNDQAGSACIRNFFKQATQPLITKGYWWSYPKFGLGLHNGEDGFPWLLGAYGQRIGVNPKNQRVFTTLSNADLRTTDSGAQAILSRPAPTN
jgi:CubicO group peptidase (beta-lactamase class C family)